MLASYSLNVPLTLVNIRCFTLKPISLCMGSMPHFVLTVSVVSIFLIFFVYPEANPNSYRDVSASGLFLFCVVNFSVFAIVKIIVSLRYLVLSIHYEGTSGYD